jgi:transcriptional regulator with XRE-family HTH domain
MVQCVLVKAIAILRERVRRCRESQGLSQAQLARVAGVPQVTISRIESGAVENPEVETLRNLASALKVTADYLIGRTERMDPAEATRLDPKLRELVAIVSEMSARERDEILSYAKFRKGPKVLYGRGSARVRG